MYLLFTIVSVIIIIIAYTLTVASYETDISGDSLVSSISRPW